MSLNCEGVPTDTSRAAQLFQKAADQGYTAGLTNLALMHVRGVGFKRDINKAASLLRLAAEQGDPDAPTYLENIRDNRPF
jgi:TPR repeat protein